MQEDFFGILGGDGDEGLEAGRTPQALSSVQYAMRTGLQAASSLMRADRFNPPILAPSRILGMLTTPQVFAIAERLAGVTNPMAEKFHSLGYAATFLYVPAATPETPYLLP